jgi:hypothetical protein
MSEDTGDGTDVRPAERRFSRRRLLALSATGLVGSVAGCSGSGDDGTETADPTPTDEATATPTATAAPTATATPEATPTDSEPTATATRTATPTFDTSYLGTSPSSSFAPTAGFGSADWLAERSDDLQVLRVTNLDRSGEGSLRWAVNQSGPRIVVFEVGGVIDLQGEHMITGGDNLYIAGQTAPAPGITVIRGVVTVTGSNTIVQHIRVRPGDRLVEGPREGPPEPAGGAVDALTLDDEISNIILDHNSASWGTDEVMSIGMDNDHVTHTNNLIAEGLSVTPVHEESEHSKATLVRPDATTVSLIGNSYINNVDRNPRLNGGSEVAIVNSFVYNFDEAIELVGEEGNRVTATITRNYYKSSDITPPNDPIVKPEQTGARAFIAFNRTEPSTIPVIRESRNLDNLRTRPVYPDGFQALPVGEVPEHNLATAGARPAERTPTDERLVEEARTDTGDIIDSQDEVGGYPVLDETERALDPPEAGDGLAEWLHQHTRAVELPDASAP